MSYGQPDDYNHGDNNSIDMVPRWFEMLKELRNGTISYIQLIKREQIRPPVRPVCRRLGVAKLSDIVSEDILYRAIVQVAESQNHGGGRAPRGDDNNDSDGTIAGSSALRLDIGNMNMNMQGQGQGQYPPNLNGNNNGWNFQHQQHQQAQNAQRLQRHSFDGPPTRGANNAGSYFGNTYRAESHHQQPHQAKSLYDRQARSSFHGVTQQYGTYADLENEHNFARRLENTEDSYGGEREIQNFGQQLFSGQDGGLNANSSLNYHNLHDVSSRPYNRPDLIPKNMCVGNKAYPLNARLPPSTNNSLNFNTLPLPTRTVGANALASAIAPNNIPEPLNYSPLSSPRTPRLGAFSHLVNNAVGVGGAVPPGGNINGRGLIGSYGYAGQGQGQGHNQVPADPRLVAENDLNASARPYAPMATQNPLGTVPRNGLYVPTPINLPSGNNGPLSHNTHIGMKLGNYNNHTGQFPVPLTSPRTTSFMPFGSANTNPPRGLGDFGEFSAGSDFGGSDGLSQQSNEESGSLGDLSNGEYYFKGDYPPSLLDPIHIARDHNYNVDSLGAALESTLDSDPNSLVYGNRFAPQSKPWECL